MKKTILASLLLASAVYANDKPKNVYKLTHLSTSDAIVTCQNGADPTFKHLTNNAVVVSCGAEIKAAWNGKQFTCPAGMFVWPDEHEEGKQDTAYCGAYPLNK